MPRAHTSGEYADNAVNQEVHTQSKTLRRSSRIKKPYGEWWKSMIAIEPEFRTLISFESPVTFRSVMSGPDSSFWKPSIDI